MHTRTVTNQLRARKLPLELVRGNGYMYFVYDTGKKYNTKSIMVPRVGDLTLAEWIKEGGTYWAGREIWELRRAVAYWKNAAQQARKRNR
jgi:hypothetical protein